MGGPATDLHSGPKLEVAAQNENAIVRLCRGSYEFPHTSGRRCARI